MASSRPPSIGSCLELCVEKDSEVQTTVDSNLASKETEGCKHKGEIPFSIKTIDRTHCRSFWNPLTECITGNQQ